jgi:hypothetical protein
MTDHMDVLRYAAGICSAGYEPGTIARGVLAQQRQVRRSGRQGERGRLHRLGLGGRVHPQIAWAKLDTLVKVAELATSQLWG